jgi:hypothetical protein
MTFTPRSQAGQDVFVRKVLVEGMGITNGTFLDVGANHPIDWSNTYELERLGWTGFLFENEPNACNMLRAGRTSPVLAGDATKIDWRHFIKEHGPHFDYLSLDIDYASHSVLLEMLVAGMSFNAATIEHNEYNYPAGDSPAWAVRALMWSRGYKSVATDVTNNGAAFEDWYVGPMIPEMVFTKFLSYGNEDGLEISAR